MNLHNIVAPVINRVSPVQTIKIKKFQDWDVDETGASIIMYETIDAKAQVQPVADNQTNEGDVHRNEITRVFYLEGDWSSLNRTTQSGGDYIEYDDKVWYIFKVDEAWKQNGWTKVTAILQLEDLKDDKHE